MIIAIDGRAASGKTTLAARLSAELGASVIHMDDFFLPENMRTAERLAEPGGNVHYERFIEEVLPHLKGSSAFSYRIFDCAKGCFNGTRDILPSEIRIVEGSYSMHPVFGNYMDFKIFTDIKPDTQLQRIQTRNGKKSANIFAEKWIPLEEKYFDIFQIMRKADIVI